MPTKEKAVTIEDCDRQIAKCWAAFRGDPKADAEDCLAAIDVWLDTRLELMEVSAPKRKKK